VGEAPRIVHPLGQRQRPAEEVARPRVIVAVLIVDVAVEITGNPTAVERIPYAMIG
jgi:hypothetical protein